MKYFYAGLLTTLLAPVTLQATPAEDALSICAIVDRYSPGSYHYFDCLNHIEAIDPKLNLEATIDYVCSAVGSFYNLDDSHVGRCHTDAQAKLNPQPLSCYPENEVLNKNFAIPASFSAVTVAHYQKLASDWNLAYRAKVEAANNGLVFDLQKSGKGCLAPAYAISLDGPNPLKDALKECVFTDINAYSGPAISPENQEVLAEEFVQANWKKYRFRKLINASLENDPITAFNTRCVLEVRSAAFQGYQFYMGGYTID